MIQQRTILFADVRGSTRIIETVGDAEGLAFVAGILDELAEVTGRFRGRVVKTIGDEVMSSFEEPLDAIIAAAEMQRLVRQREPLGDIRPQIKVGIHGGPVILEDEDVHGDVVNVAARVVGMAKGEQILTTAETLAELGEAQLPTRSLGFHELRGKDAPLELREVLWEENPDMLTTMPAAERPELEAQLEIRVGARVLQMSSPGGEARSIGRGEENDLVVADSSASRNHADIVPRGGRFYLRDHSTNGTYVRPRGGEEMFVHRDEILLGGRGSIRLGRSFAEPEGPALEYRVIW